ncbi:MAG TPA: hypothetical protein VKS60_01650 [Stellaceae bacterium]|nr:hypothetical protein [Stellaceae bacterium]
MTSGNSFSYLEELRSSGFNDVIASRELMLLGSGPVRIEIGRPWEFVDDGHGWYCPFRIVGLNVPEYMYGAGEDAVQALWLALANIGTILYTSTEWQAGRLRQFEDSDDGNLGFPAIAPIAVLVPNATPAAI